VSDLKPLIRLTKFRLDDMRRLLAQLHAESDMLRRAIADHDAEVVREREVARENTESRLVFGAYLRRMSDRRDQLMAEIFMEQKRLEIVEQNRIDEERREVARKETQVLDETGAIAHLRRKASRI
jgi:hypothetical protein